MRSAPFFVLVTFVLAACGGATTPQEPVVVAPDDDGGAPKSSSSTEPSCIAGEIVCSGSCTDTTSDAKHCGTCGRVCDKGQRCSSGACAIGDAG
jgi:hypothetical protein